MAEGITTGASNANAVATVVAARALPVLRSQTAALQCSDPSYKKELASFGDTVNVPIPTDYTTNLLADGGTINRQNVTLGNAALVLNKHRECSFEHTDVNKAKATPDIEWISKQQALANFCEDVDEDMLGVYATFTGTAVGAYNAALTEAVIDSAETGLFDQKVAGGTPINLIVTGNGYSSIRQIPRFSETDKDKKAAGSQSRTIKGTIKGFNVHRAQKVNVTSSTSRHGLALAPAALLTAIRPLGDQTGDGTIQVELSEDGLTIRITMSYHHEVLGRLCTLDMLYGYVTGRSAHGIEVKH